MPSLEIEEYRVFETFSDDWAASETDTRMFWQLLGQLDDDELLIKIPNWLAEENTGYVGRDTPRGQGCRIHSGAALLAVTRHSS